LQATSSSSLNRKALPLILLFSLSLVRCTASTIWGIPLNELEERLAHGDAALLNSIRVTPENRGEALRLGKHAPYYLAQQFRILGRPDEAQELLRLQWEKGAAPWSEEALLELLVELIAQERYDEAEREARDALGRLRDPRRAYLAERLLVEALYWQRKDDEVLERLGRLRRTAAEVETVLGGVASGEDLWDDELQLFDAVAGCRSGRGGWQGSFVRLFVESRAGTLHGRAFAFLEQGDRLADFAAPEQALLRAKLQLAGGATAETVVLLEQALPGITSLADSGGYGSVGELQWATLLFETATAGFASGQHNRVAGLLQSVAAELPEADALYARELAGRLLRRAGGTGEARGILREVVASTSSASQRDRAAWFLLDLVRRNGLEAFLAELQELSPDWNDPAYFGDLIEEEITSLVSEGRWRDLARLRSALGTNAPSACRARLAYLLGRAALLGLPGAPVTARGSSLLVEARNADPGGYHSLLAAALLGTGDASEAGSGLPAGTALAEELAVRDEPDPRAAEEGLLNDPPEIGDTGRELSNPTGKEDGRAAAASTAEDIEILRGFLSFGLLDQAYELLTRRPDGRIDGRRTLVLPAAPTPGRLPPELLREAAARLNGEEKYLLSIRLMNRYLARGSGSPTKADLELLYPRGYAGALARVAESFAIHSALFYALVREESHFDPAIVSRSGAVGLMQLMEETAADSARRLRIEQYDLRNPETNLRLGAEHFSRLLSRLDSIPKALMAYNAGLSRVRSWERRYTSLPQDLLVEAVPFPETRGYVRKILVSAVQYDRLYYGLDLRSTALRFYPQLGRQGEQPK
jgi:hypothetical protein